MIDVIVNGGGPVGLMLACELRLRDVSVTVLEAKTEIDPTIKAGAVSGRGADLLERRGLTETLTDLGATTMAHLAKKLGAGSLQAKTGRPGVTGHFAGLFILREGSQPGGVPLIVSQQILEQALTERAVALGVDLRRGHTLTGFTDDITVSVTGPDGPYELAGRWLAGCDGGRSLVRKTAGFTFPGLDGIMTGHQAIVEFDDPDFFPFGWHRVEHGLLVRGPVPGRVMTVEFDGPPADRDAPITRAELQASVRRLSGTDVTITRVESVTRFTDNTRQAETYRKGRVLLAGDAAHIHPPFGGQGLNLGLGDAANLGWKLALCVRGQASSELLDTYTTERHPVAADTLHNTRAQVALLRPGPHVDALRDIFGMLADTDEANRALTDLMGDLAVRYAPGDHPLTGTHCPDLALKTADGDTRVAELARTGRALLLDLTDDPALRSAVSPWTDRVDIVTGQSTHDTAILVRPDGYVAWAGTDLEGLRSAATHWFGTPSTVSAVRQTAAYGS